jgi:segregation and condensation protein B
VGRPALYATTKHFLDDLGIVSLDQLPLQEGVSQQVEIMEGLDAFGMPPQSEMSAPSENHSN